MKTLFKIKMAGVVALAVIVLGVFMLWQEQAEAPVEIGADENVTGNVTVGDGYKNATYMIDGSPVTLVDGYAEEESVPGSAVKVITRVFGNELMTDLDGDGDQDVAFLLTQEGGGSGVFFYAVAALKTNDGYVGSDGYLLGDRIAPQSTNLSPNPRHQYVVTFNYADRASGEPMTAEPSVGKSAYLKIVPEINTWAIVEPDFEGESAF